MPDNDTQKPQPRPPRRMSERLNLLLGLRIDVAYERYAEAHRACRDDRCDVTGKPRDPDCTRAGPPCRLRSSPPMAKLHIITLGDCHGDDGRIFPGFDYISRVMCCGSRHTVSNAQFDNEALGLVRITRRNRDKEARLTERTNWYVIDWARVHEFQDSQCAECTGSPGALSALVQVHPAHQVECTERTSASALSAPKPLRATAKSNREAQTAAASLDNDDTAAAADLRSELIRRRIPHKDKARGDLAVAGAGILTARHVREALDAARQRKGVRNAQKVAALILWDMIDAANELARAGATTAQHAAPMTQPAVPSDPTCNGDRAREVRRQVEAERREN